MLFVVSGPSGAGKSTLCTRLLEQNPGLRMSISFTTRPVRGTEQHGVEYYFVSPDEFRSMVQAGALAEHALVHGNHYGTARETIDRFSTDGHDVLFDIDYQGSEQLKAAYPDAVTTMILPPSVELLESRLRSRATDSEDVVQRRMAKALHEMAHASRFDYVLVNETLELALAQLQAIYDAERLRAHRSASGALQRVGLGDAS